MNPRLQVCLSILFIALFCGCVTARNDHKVKKTLYINHKVVYVLEPNQSDKDAMMKGAKEAEEACEDVTFEPSKTAK